jgi:hypothetical protein
MAGRKPLGPELVQHLDGSPHAKQRLEVILETLAGHWTIAQACAQLGIGEAMFHRLRMAVLQAGIDRLEPRAIGRPPRAISPEQQRIAELEAQLAQLDQQRRLAELRTEVTQIMATRAQSADEKKTTSLQQQRKQRQRLLRRRKKSR